MFKNRNQKIILVIICSLLLVTIAFKTFTCEYSRPAYVDRIEGEIITFIDRHGNLWLWNKEENEDFCLNEKVNLVFDNNGTDVFVEDDIILRIEKK